MSVPLIVEVPTKLPVYAAVALTPMIRLSPAARTLLKVADVLLTVPLTGVGGDATAPAATAAAVRPTSGTSSRRTRLVFMLTPFGSSGPEIPELLRHPGNPNKLGFARSGLSFMGGKRAGKDSLPRASGAARRVDSRLRVGAARSDRRPPARDRLRPLVLAARRPRDAASSQRVGRA